MFTIRSVKPNNAPRQFIRGAYKGNKLVACTLPSIDLDEAVHAGHLLYQSLVRQTLTVSASPWASRTNPHGYAPETGDRFAD